MKILFFIAHLFILGLCMPRHASAAYSTSFICSFSLTHEMTPYLSYYDDGFRFSPGNLIDGPFELVATFSERFDDKPGDQVIFTNKNRNGDTTINDFPKYSEFKQFCPTNVCRLLIDKPVAVNRRHALAKAMIQKKTAEGNFKNYKTINCDYDLD